MIIKPFLGEEIPLFHNFANAFAEMQNPEKAFSFKINILELAR